MRGFQKITFPLYPPLSIHQKHKSQCEKGWPVLYFFYRSMTFPLYEVSVTSELPQLGEIPEPPVRVYARGQLPPQGHVSLAVVGSRQYSNYGKRVVEYLVAGLRNYPIAIVSGLALGIDALAHKTALEAGLYTLAVPGSGLDDSVLYPRTNRTLAQRILESGGGLLSEFEPSFKATPWSFPQRNRIMVGLSRAVLLIEASERSGTLITARLASDYNRDVLAVPGDIFSDNTKGTHQFIKLGATPVTTPADIVEALRLEEVEKVAVSEVNLTEEEFLIIAALSEPRERDELLRLLPLAETETLALLMRMELDGKISEQNGVLYKIE